MDPALIESTARAISRPPDSETRQLWLELAPGLGGLSKELRDAVAYAVNDLLYPNDVAVASAVAPYRKEALQKSQVLERVRDLANAYPTPAVPLKEYPEAFDLVAGLLAVLATAGESQTGWIAAMILYSRAQADPEQRTALAEALYTPAAVLKPEAAAFFAAPTPDWVKAKFDAVLGDAKPRPVQRRAWGTTLRSTARNLGQSARRGEPSFVFALAVMVLAVLLFGVSIVVAQSRPTPVVAAAPIREIPAPTVPAASVPELTVYELLTQRLKAKSEEYRQSVFVVGPRARDGADIVVVEALTNADLKSSTIVLWAMSRAALGQDAPNMHYPWLQAGDCHAFAQDGITVYYVDLEMLSSGQARISLVAQGEAPSVTMIVTGPATNLQLPPRSASYLERIRNQPAMGSYACGLLLRQARAAAITERELALADLFEVKWLLARGLGAAETKLLALRSWHAWTDAERAELPEPFVRSIAGDLKSSDDRGKDRLEFRK